MGTRSDLPADQRLDLAGVHAIAEREGWLAKYRKRGGKFGVIEFWIEGTRMIEVLTPAMQGEYLGAMTAENWKFLRPGASLPAVTVAMLTRVPVNVGAGASAALSRPVKWTVRNWPASRVVTPGARVRT